MHPLTVQYTLAVGLSVSMFVGTAAAIEWMLKSPTPDETALIYVPHEGKKFAPFVVAAPLAPFLPPVIDTSADIMSPDDFLNYFPELTLNLGELDSDLTLNFDLSPDVDAVSQDWPTWPELRDTGDVAANSSNNDTGGGTSTLPESAESSSSSGGIDPNFGLGSTGENGEARSFTPAGASLPLQAAPEPSTYVLMLAGMIVLGATVRRRSNKK
jgi:hypothetical protein